MFTNETEINNYVDMSDRHIGIGCQVFVTGSHVVGIVGNVIALVSLRCTTRQFRKTHLLLRCLAANDLVALATSLVLMHLQLYLYALRRPVFRESWFCALRVLLRAFGLGSGCIATVMAIERWTALVKPFGYKKVLIAYHAAP